MVHYYYYYGEDGFKRGPFSLSELTELADTRKIAPETMIETDSGQRGKAVQLKGLFPNGTKGRSPFQTSVSTLDSDIGEILRKPTSVYCKRCRALLRKGQVLCPECGYDNTPEDQKERPHDPADAKRIKNAYTAYLFCYLLALFLTMVGVGCLTICITKALFATYSQREPDNTWNVSEFSIPDKEEMWDDSLFSIVISFLRYYSPVSLFTGIIFTFLGNLLGGVALVFMMVLLYEMWQQVPRRFARTSPGLAVVLLFIPFFSMFWRFVAFYGLAKSLNESLEEAECRQRTNPGLALTVCILRCLELVPGIQCVLVFFMPIMLANLKRGAETLAVSDDT